MTDIAGRLRGLAYEHHEMLDNVHLPLMEAADEIERLRGILDRIADENLGDGARLLREENGRLRAALREIADVDEGDQQMLLYAVYKAREALGEDE